MTTLATRYDEAAVSADRRHRLLHLLVTAAAPFDGAMGILCLVATNDVARLLSVGSGTVRGIGAVFLLAAVTGIETALRPSIGVRWIVGANAVFAAWCLAAIGYAEPNAAGTSLLAVAAVASAGTALVEHRLAGRWCREGTTGEPESPGRRARSSAP